MLGEDECEVPEVPHFSSDLTHCKGWHVNGEATSLETLARLVGGKLVGDGATRITGAAPLYEVGPGQISLFDGGSVSAELQAKSLTAVVVGAACEELDCAQLIVARPREAFAAIVSHFLPGEVAGSSPTSLATIDTTARLGRDCQVSPGVVIGAHARIGDRCRLMPGVVVMEHVEIGDDCVIFPNVTLYERTRLGQRVTIHAGSVLGAYGFGYQSVDGAHQRTAQLGYVQIEDDVELGACVTIDRGTYGSTRIGRGTKVDNQVMIGHNCQIGKHNLLCSQVGIAGSCRTGDYVVLAGQVGLKDHITLGDGAIVGAQSGVMEDLPGGQVYLGSPATTQREQMQIMAVQRRLPEMRRTVKQLERGARDRSESQASTDSHCELPGGTNEKAA